jgi:hypothetical protein
MGPKTAMEVLKTIDSMLTDRRDDIASIMARDGELTVSLSVKLRSERDGAVIVDVKLGYVAERVADVNQIRVDEKQLDLFGGGDAV